MNKKLDYFFAGLVYLIVIAVLAWVIWLSHFISTISSLKVECLSMAEPDTIQYRQDIKNCSERRETFE